MEMVPVSSNPKRIAVISDQEKEKMDLTGRAKNYAIKDRVTHKTLNLYLYLLSRRRWSGKYLQLISI